MKVHDYLLVAVTFVLTASAAILSFRAELNSLAVAALAFLTLAATLIAWSAWLHGVKGLQITRIILLNGLSTLLFATIWFELVLSELGLVGTGSGWIVAAALAWMITPLASLGLSDLGRRLLRRL